MKCKNSYLHKISKNNQYSRYYAERFFGMKCMVDMQILGMYPNLKESTESFGCFEAVVNNFDYTAKDNINIVCVGDGHTPRTAAMFAFRSPWTTYSIDPALKNKFRYNRIKRLSVISDKIENVNLELDKPTIIVHCHAHVKIETSLAHIKSPKTSVVSMECCVKQFIQNKPPDIEYNDNCIWSPCNRIKIWK